MKVLILVLFCLCLPLMGKDKKPIIADPIVEKKVRLELNKPTGVLTESDLGKVVGLRFYPNEISDESLSELVKLPKLEGLNIAGNKRINLSTVAKLTQLKSLDLSGNQIVDASPLAKLRQLKQLGISDNKEIDLSTLTKITQIESLTLRRNQITDISPLAKLTQLKFLDLSGSEIADTRPLTELTQLKKLVWVMNLTPWMKNGTDHTPEKVAQINKSVTPGCVVTTSLNQIFMINEVAAKNESKETITKRAKKLTPEEKQVVGSWLMKDSENGFRLNFFEDGTCGASDNKRVWGPGKWSIENKEVHRNLGRDDGVEILKINPDGSLTVVGMISSGIRVRAPKQFQHNFIKSK